MAPQGAEGAPGETTGRRHCHRHCYHHRLRLTPSTSPLYPSQRKIVHTKVKVPTWFTNEARTLVRGLLTKEANQRLGVDPDSPTHASDMTSLKVR